MTFRKTRPTPKALTTIAVVLCILVTVLLQKPNTFVSQKLTHLRTWHPLALTRDLVADDAEPAADREQSHARGHESSDLGPQRQPSIHDDEFDWEEEGESDDAITGNDSSEEHEVERASEEDLLREIAQEQSATPENENKVQKGQREKRGPLVELPPRLGPSLAHLKRSPENPLTAPLEWGRPMMLSALAIPRGEKLVLSMFETGVNLIGFERTFTVVGCLVGNKTYPTSPNILKDGRSPYYCQIDSDVPEGSAITLLITRDEKLEQALAEPYVIGQFTFEVGEEDLMHLDGDVKIGKGLRQLSGGYEIVGIKSNITWHEGLREREFAPEKKRYELCLMTAMRQYPFLMQQWFDYYRQMGVDQIYVYDNVATEDLSKFDSDFVQTGFWPYGRSQFQSFNHFLQLSRNRCKYVGFLDADEYIFVGDSEPGALKRYIKKWTSKGYSQIVFPFILMAGVGQIERPEGLLPNLYVRRDLRQTKFHVGKSIISTDYEYARHLIHFVVGGKKIYANRTFELNPTSLDHNAMLMHYTRRSWEEMIMKVNTGGASVVTNARPPKNFTMQSVPAYYKSNRTTVEFLTFRDHWRTIMAREKPKDVSLVWQDESRECKQRFCIACTKKKLVGKAECKFGG